MFIYLKEIKCRVIFSFLSYFFVLLITYCYKEIILFLVVVQLNTNSFNFKKFCTFYIIFTGITEIFSAYINLINFFSLHIFLICVVYHISVFLTPALYKIEYNLVNKYFCLVFNVWVFALVVLAILFLPLLFNFFLEFQSLISRKSFRIYFEVKLSEYLSFCYAIYCSFCLQIFILILLAIIFKHTVKTFSARKKFRKFYYFCFLVLSTLISPPDIMSQILISCSLSIVYEFLFMVYLFLS